VLTGALDLGQDSTRRQVLAALASLDDSRLSGLPMAVPSG
jgi:hypothetical protein